MNNKTLMKKANRISYGHDDGYKVRRGKGMQIR